MQEKYLVEVKEHHRLRTSVLIDSKTDTEMSFFDTLKEHYLTYINMYLDHVLTLSSKLYASEHNCRSLQSQILTLTLSSQSFANERSSLLSRLDKAHA